MVLSKSLHITSELDPYSQEDMLTSKEKNCDDYQKASIIFGWSCVNNEIELRNVVKYLPKKAPFLFKFSIITEIFLVKNNDPEDIV